MKICDWEMSSAGPIGQDAGWFQSFPVAGVLYQAVHGRPEVGQKMFGQLEAFWKEYESTLRANGKDDDEYIRQVYLNSFAWNAFFLGNVYYLVGGHVLLFPLDELAGDEQAMFKGSYGYVGLRLLDAAFGKESPVKDYSLPQLQAFYKDIVMTEIAELSAARAKNQRKASPRRSSVLRASGRRMSDAGAIEAAAFRASMQLRASVRGCFRIF